MLVRWLLHSHLLEVVWEDHHGDAALGLGDAIGAVDEVRHLRRHVGGLDVLRHVLEDALQVEVLLVMRPDGRARLLPDERQHRLVIELRVVKPVQKVESARPLRREAHADLARELGMADGHEPGHFLVTNLHQLDRALQASQRAHEPADTVAGIAEHSAHAPGMQAPPDEISNRLGHGASSGRPRVHAPGTRIGRGDARLTSQPRPRIRPIRYERELGRSVPTTAVGDRVGIVMVIPEPRRCRWRRRRRAGRRRYTVPRGVRLIELMFAVAGLPRPLRSSLMRRSYWRGRCRA